MGKTRVDIRDVGAWYIDDNKIFEILDIIKR